MKVERSLLFALPLAALLALGACGPQDQDEVVEDRGDAAPDLTSETSPPPLPPPPDDTTGIVERAPAAP